MDDLELQIFLISAYLDRLVSGTFGDKAAQKCIRYGCSLYQVYKGLNNDDSQDV